MRQLVLFSTVFGLVDAWCKNLIDENRVMVEHDREWATAIRLYLPYDQLVNTYLRKNESEVFHPNLDGGLEFLTSMSQSKQSPGVSKAARKRANKKKRSQTMEAEAKTSKAPDAPAASFTAMFKLQSGTHDYELLPNTFAGLYIPGASWRLANTSIAVIRGDNNPGFITLQVGNVQRVYGAAESRPLVLMQPGPWVGRDAQALVIRATVESNDAKTPLCARLSVLAKIHFSNNPPPF